MAVSRRLRFEILKRDGYTCRYCGAKAPDVVLTVDHVIPTALGGGDEPSNLVAACQPCNAGKTSVAPDAPLVASVADDALRWAKAVKMAAYYAGGTDGGIRALARRYGVDHAAVSRAAAGRSWKGVQ